MRVSNCKSRNKESTVLKMTSDPELVFIPKG